MPRWCPYLPSVKNLYFESLMQHSVYVYIHIFFTAERTFYRAQQQVAVRIQSQQERPGSTLRTRQDYFRKVGFRLHKIFVSIGCHARPIFYGRPSCGRQWRRRLDIVSSSGKVLQIFRMGRALKRRVPVTSSSTFAIRKRNYTASYARTGK